MRLNNLFFGGLLFLSSAGFAQEKLHFDVYDKGEQFFSPKLKIGYFEKNSNEMNFSFLFGIYSLDFKKINDSTYREVINTGFFWNKKEIFDYSFNDSCYVFNNYSSIGDGPRAEKDSLEGTVFNKKYKTLLDLFNNFESNNLKDSVYFILLGEIYSTKIRQENNLVFFWDLEFIKEEPGDFIIFPHPVEIRARKKGKKIIPYKFSTKYKNVRYGTNSCLEGCLREGD